MARTHSPLSRAQRAFAAYWMDFRVSDAKLYVFRTLFFGLLALDSFLQIAHAPRYGVGGFNVSHVPWLDGLLPLPERKDMLVLYLLQTYLAGRIALGGASRAAYAVLAGAFGLGYFISQLNSYQHHYLLFVMLTLCAFFPWPDLRGDDDDQRSHWPLRMLQVSLSIMYFYAAVAKMDPQWLDGTTVSQQVTADWIREPLESLGWSAVAKLTLGAELCLAVLVLWRRLWPLALAIALPMHLCFEFSGLRIGLFSYFMVATYILFVPDGWLSALGSLVPARLHRENTPPSMIARIALWAFGLSAGALLLAVLPFGWGTLALCALLLSAAALLDLVFRRPPFWSATGHVLAVGLVLIFAHQTDTLRDYYRFWGGAQRRMGDIPGATKAYEKVTRIAPRYSSGHRHLGDLYARADREDEALEEYRRAVLLRTDNWKAYLGLARIFHKKRRGTLALQSAQEVLRIRPNQRSARRIQSYWQSRLRQSP